MTMKRTNTEQGAATLVTALVLMMATTTLVLATAHTRLTGQHMDGNSIQTIRQYQAAEAALDDATDYLLTTFNTMSWQASSNGSLSRLTRPSDTISSPLQIEFYRQHTAPGFIRIRTRAGDVQLEQIVRPLSILTPAGEQAPPLVIDGCITDNTGNPDLYPEKRLRGTNSQAIWSSTDSNCHQLGKLDLHNGTVTGNRFGRGKLWTFLFSVKRGELKVMADRERARLLPASHRRYWWADASQLQAGHWTRSLGTPRQPVVLVFPAALGCPSLADGTTIYGLVFYEGNCSSMTRLITGTVYGTLAVNSSLASYSDRLLLTHISHINGPGTRLAFPIIQVPRLPGTWTDF